jgi:hypothetical protein
VYSDFEFEFDFDFDFDFEFNPTALVVGAEWLFRFPIAVASVDPSMHLALSLGCSEATVARGAVLVLPLPLFSSEMEGVIGLCCADCCLLFGYRLVSYEMILVSYDMI